MPLVRIDPRQGKNPEYRRKIGDMVYRAMGRAVARMVNKVRRSSVLSSSGLDWLLLYYRSNRRRSSRFILLIKCLYNTVQGCQAT